MFGKKDSCVYLTYFWLSSVANSYIQPSFVLQFLHMTSRTMWRPVNMTRSWMFVYVKLTTRLKSNARPKIRVQDKKIWINFHGFESRSSKNGLIISGWWSFNICFASFQSSFESLHIPFFMRRHRRKYLHLRVMHSTILFIENAEHTNIWSDFEFKSKWNH